MNSISKIKSEDSLLSCNDSYCIKDKSKISFDIAEILEQALAGDEISEQQAVLLFQAEGVDIKAIAQCADTLRQRSVGDSASFVITRNINFTNICYMGCKFCGFSKSKNDPDAQLLSMQEIANRAQEAWDRGATEVCIQGGLHPDLPADHYRNILLAIKQQVPKMHIHAFSPFEIMFGSQNAKLSYKAFIQDLIDCGLGSMPGTAAEILDVEIRQQLTRDKLTSEQWCEIISAAHQLGLPTTATIMYGHIDGPSHWAAHIGLIREMQKQHGGFTEFVPLGFVHYESPLYTERKKLKLAVRPGPTANENILMHAVSRIMLNGWIDNIQASWVKLGPDYAVQMLRAGANDLGGTLMDETITRSSGGIHGEEILPTDMVKLIQRSELKAYRRDTLYQPLEHFSAQLIASSAGCLV
ncbi:MAG: 5-amino-6-(D-ribitylamino)uracil--L-tyrosine 4-hydroxyphenyl transferase CofH [Oceanospirillaceae bacterium]|nr:5-amino-6-(D-ribitylamino)uracil--L-tyrosine 4-hydroxyphenyl transferase CofH [Oceanospirillaceae bacterium]